MKLNLTESVQIPMIGFGTYLINTDEAKTCVLNAIRIGYRHIDTAEGYGNETGVGHALKNAQKELGISREDLFVTTKLWPGNEAWGQTLKTYDSTIESLNSSLSNLELDYVDLYLIHAPFAKSKRLEQWNALVELRKQGKAKAIGVSNFSKSHIEEIKSAGSPLPDANQIELHPWSQKSELVSYLRENRISPIAYSSLVPLAEWRVVEGQDSSKTEKMKSDGASNGYPFKAMEKNTALQKLRFYSGGECRRDTPFYPRAPMRKGSSRT